MFTYILYGATAILLVISLVRDRGKTRAALLKAWKAFENILPQFLSTLLIIGMALSVLDAATISKFAGRESGFLGVLGLGLLGAITLIPAFIAFPLAASLLKNGAGYMQLGAFVSTLMIVGVLTLPVEMKYFGKKAALLRNGLSFLFSFGIAYVIGAVLG
jgi:uncharacterized membrane protein YraQ (UPF0718 family)